jgi:hypothetical protein
MVTSNEDEAGSLMTSGETFVKLFELDVWGFDGVVVDAVLTADDVGDTGDVGECGER